MTKMKLSEFDYELPKNLIAQQPLSKRSNSKLMVLQGNSVIHKRFSDFPSFLRKGDVLVLNDSEVIPAKLRGTKETGGRVEVLVLGGKGPVRECLVQGRVRAGMKISFPYTEGIVERKLGGRCNIRFMVNNLDDYMREFGEVPLPPYIKQPLDDKERYQTIYAKRSGSVAAPTAGLHFEESILDRLRKRGVLVAHITLHIGPATFLPVRTENIEDHILEKEYFEISEASASAVNSVYDSGGRLFAVGTTTVRALESSCENGRIRPVKGWTSLYIYPPYDFKSSIHALLTNLHLPRSTLLMLVSAFAGRERIKKAYSIAIEKKYRFYSFGDAMLIFR